MGDVRSSEVLRIGRLLLQNSSNLGVEGIFFVPFSCLLFICEEEWDIKMRILIAGIDEYDAQIVSVFFLQDLFKDSRLKFLLSFKKKKYYKEIKEKFPNSSRQRRLHGMISEAQGKLKDASIVYKSLLQEDPTDSVFLESSFCLLLLTV